MNKLYRMTTEEFEKRKILYAHDDTKYIGQFNGEDEKNGYGEYTNSKTNDVYLGFWSNGEVVFLSC